MIGSVKNQVRQAVPALVILILMVIAAAVASDRFFTAANLRNVLTQTAVLAVVSAAQCLVLLIGGIDMSVSSVISISTIIMAMFSSSGPAGFLVSLILVLVAGAATGFVNGVGVVKFKIPPMIITISTQAFVKGIGLLLMPGSGGKVSPAFVKLVKTKFGIFSAAFLAAVVLYGVYFLVLHDTAFGRKVYAVGNGELYAEQSGIDTKKVTLLVYIAAGLTAAFAGLLLAARISTGNPLVGDNYGMDSVAAAVVGGISMNGGVGSVVGALFGALILTLINNIMNSMGISPYYQYILKGAVLMGALMLFQMKRRRRA